MRKQLAFTKGPWKKGKYSAFVVSDHPVEVNYPGHHGDGGVNETTYYGGHLIAESVLREENAHLIAHAPELYEMLHQFTSVKNEDELTHMFHKARELLQEIDEGMHAKPIEGPF